MTERGALGSASDSAASPPSDSTMPFITAISWSMSTRMMLDKACLSCRETWGMHHRCPALGGRFNCC